MEIHLDHFTQLFSSFLKQQIFETGSGNCLKLFTSVFKFIDNVEFKFLLKVR